MANVNSVLGPLDTSDLGFTLSHEHILLSSAGIRHVYPEFIDRQRTIEEAVSHLSEARREGVGTLIDVGKGRFTPEDIPRILAACDRSQAGPTAPPEGLYLVEVEYPEQNSLAP